MPYRKIVFANNEIYHVFNRGAANAPIFLSPKEYQRFLNLLDFYRYSKPTLSFSHYNRLSLKDKTQFMENLKRHNSLLVEILTYCLIPNHFH